MYRNVFHAAYVIVKKHGIRGAYQGLPATWLRNIPANSAFFGKFHRLDIFPPIIYVCCGLNLVLAQNF